MIILNNMYTGRYITEQGMLGHEAINLFRADQDHGGGKFYIWLNSMGVCGEPDVNGSTVVMVRTVNSRLYKVLAKAVGCELCAGASISRKRQNKGTEDKKARYRAQKAMDVRYGGKDPMDHIYREEDMFATFRTETLLVPEGDVYLTNDPLLADARNHIYYADFKISEAMRAYIRNGHSGEADLEAFLAEDFWVEPPAVDVSRIKKPEFNFFKLIRKDRDELAFSNALAYFAESLGVRDFLDGCLKLPPRFLEDDYRILREKNNIDISFFGKEHVVIIENKIDAGITVDGRSTAESQVKRAVEQYLAKESEGVRKEVEKTIGKVFCAEGKQTSQLSKYYFYACAYLLKQGVAVEEVASRIRCFLLIPEYARNQFRTDENGCYASGFLLSEQYRILTYKDIWEYFSGVRTEDLYLKEFCSAMMPLKKEFNNDLEEEMKYRFFKTIGKI